MKKYFSFECPNCGDPVTIEVGVTLNEHGEVVMEGISSRFLNFEGNGTYVAIPCAESRIAEVSRIVPRTAPESNVDFDVNVRVVEPDAADNELDSITRQIEDGGYVNNGHLFRRWIMAMDARAESGDGGITAWIHSRGYEYMWRSAIHEIEVTLKIQQRDPVNYEERIRWMNKDMYVAMAKDYLRQLREYVDRLGTHKRNGRDYKRLAGRRDIFCDEMGSKLFNPIEKIVSKLERTSLNRSFLDTIKEFNKKRVVVKSFEQCREWIDAFKAVGAYYTLKNAVLFHNVYITKEDGARITGSEALEYIRAKAIEYSVPDENGHEQGYKLYGLKREVMRYNEFDFEARMHELGIR